MIKLFEACNWNLPTSVYWLIWIVAAATMTAGNVLALLQTNVKRILAYSSIAHSGYMLIGLLVGPVAGVGPLHDGVAALLFYIAVYGLMNLGAFAVLSAFAVRGHLIEDLTDLAGLSKRHPWSAMALAICAFSLMGFPPTAGFLGKVYIFSSAFSLSADHPFHGPLIVLAVIAVINSAIAAVYYLRIATTAYLGTQTEPVRPAPGYSVRVALAVCSVAMLFWFVWPAHLSDPAHQATTELARHGHAPATQLALDDDLR
ncbi:MAG: hypothetical protein GY778_21370 [bacterium]|nr:hypothetical protein [bacterium]